MVATELASDLISIADREGRIVFANPAYAAATGSRVEELLGQALPALRSERSASLYERTWSSLLRGEVLREVFVSRHRDGSARRVEQTISPVRDGAGTLRHLVATGREVDSRPATEDATRRIQEVSSRAAREWRTTFDAIDVPILVLDDQLLVRRPNRAARDLVGQPYVALLGARVGDLGPEPLFVSLGRVAETTRLSGRSAAEPVESHGRFWEATATLLGTDVGARDGVIVIARDVTSIVQLHRELRQSETMSAMGRLVAGVAHEVRNPLFAISSIVDAFEEELETHAGLADFCRRLRREVDRMSSLMQELLDYGRPAAADVVQVHLGEVLDVALRACEPHAAAAGVALHPEGGPLPTLLGEPLRLAQAFQNLIQNGVQHSPPGSRVVIRTVDDGSEVEVAVLDSGPGFRRDDLPHVFEPFFTRRRGGTGMGLAIVHRVVLQHRGSVSAANRVEGGAVLTVRLPRRHEASGSRTASAGSEYPAEAEPSEDREA